MLLCKSWNGKEICSNLVKDIPPAKDMDNSIPSGKVSELFVIVPAEENGKFDVYIDSFIGITVDIKTTNLDSKWYPVR